MGPALTLLLKVLTAHLLGDFVFQTDRAAKDFPVVAYWRCMAGKVIHSASDHT